MYVFRMREYSTKVRPSPNNHKHKIEAVSELMAQSAASYEKDWIYFFVDLTAPEVL
jgi:hypothetical protein